VATREVNRLLKRSKATAPGEQFIRYLGLKSEIKKLVQDDKNERIHRGNAVRNKRAILATPSAHMTHYVGHEQTV
jgi:hypothetical protein